MAYFGGVSTRHSIPRSVFQLAAFLVLLAASSTFLLLNPDVRGAIGAFIGRSTESLQSIGEPVTVVKEVIVEVPAAKTEVLVSVHNIQAGTKLHPALFKLAPRSLEGMEEKVVTTFDAVRGHYTNSVLVAGTPVLKLQISKYSPSQSLISEIPQGYRAVAIPVDAESGVEGWVLPGVYVDVIWATEHRGKTLVTTIVENAKVISAARSTEVRAASAGGADAEEDKQPVPKYVTLMLALKDAQKVQLAKKTSGSLSLSLRGEADKGEHGSDTMTVDQLFRKGELASLEQDQGRVRVGQQSYVVRGGVLVKLARDSEASVWQLSGGAIVTNTGDRHGSGARN